MTENFAINARFVTQPLTGIQRYCHEVAMHLTGASLLAPSAALEDYAGVRSRVTVGGHPLRGHPWEQLALPLMIPRRQPLFSPAGCGPLAHSNQVVTIHDLAPLEYPGWYSASFALWYSHLLPTLSKRVRRIVTVSEFCKQRIAEVLGVDERRITVAAEAAGNVFFPRTQERSQETLLKLGIEPPYFLFVGALSGRKNLARLIGAWRGVEHHVNGASLVIVGRDGLRFADGKGIGALPASVKRFPPVNDEDLACLYSAAQGFLYPSLYEGFGLPILEAMACGCPVLTSNCTAMPEVAGDAALLVDPLNENSVGEGIVALMAEGMASDLRAKGFRRCREFSWSRTAQIVQSAILN